MTKNAALENQTLIRLPRWLRRWNPEPARAARVRRSCSDRSRLERSRAERLNDAGDRFLQEDSRERAVACFLEAGELFVETGFQAKARALFRKVVRLDPRHALARSRLAQLYREGGLLAEAARWAPPPGSSRDEPLGA